MDINEVREILSNISFAPSNLDMGWEWDVKNTKIFDQNDIMTERGFSIRTTFMRPDSNTGEIEKGYGRWMYIPENISTDGVVKTGWLCAELIVKHELMESFLFQQTRIFDPHKSLNDLGYHGRTVDLEEIRDISNEPIEKINEGDIDIRNISTEEIIDKVKDKLSKKIGEKYDIRKKPTLTEGKEISNTKPGPTTPRPKIKPAPQKPIAPENSLIEEGGNATENIKPVEEDKLDEIIHDQNVDNHRDEISVYLEERFKNTTIADDGMPRYTTANGVHIFHNIESKGVFLTNSGGQVVDHRGGDKGHYTLSDVKDLLKNIPEAKKNLADASDVNEMIFKAGYINGEPVTEEDSTYWIFSNPTKKHRFIVHSELEKSINLINQNKEVLKSFEGDEYIAENIKTIL